MIGRESNRNNFPVLGKSRNKGRICAQKGLLPISRVMGSFPEARFLGVASQNKQQHIHQQRLTGSRLLFFRLGSSGSMSTDYYINNSRKYSYKPNGINWYVYLKMYIFKGNRFDIFPEQAPIIFPVE